MSLSLRINAGEIGWQQRRMSLKSPIEKRGWERRDCRALLAMTDSEVIATTQQGTTRAEPVEA